jgi:dipeptidyl aminopeptidase/acylaminoacyl peptidase
MLKVIPALLVMASSPLAIAIGGSAAAQQLSGSLSSAEAAQAFGAREKIIDAAIAPAGEQVALIVPGAGRSTILNIVDLKTGKAEGVSSADGDPLKLSSCGWVSDARLLCSHFGISDVQGAMLGYSRLAALDKDGSNVLPLGARERAQNYVQQSDGYVIDWLDGTGDKVLMARNYVPARAEVGKLGGIFDGLGVDLMDTRTGKVDHVEGADRLARSYLADGRGKIRIKATDESLRFDSLSKGIVTFRYRLSGSNDWKPFSTYTSSTNEGMYPIAVDGTANVAYGLKKTDGRDAVYRIALDGSMATELVFAHPQVDVTGIVRIGRQGRVIGASYVTDKRDVIYFDPAYKRLAQELSKTIPRLPLIRFVDSSAEEKRHLLHASSDVDPGKYYLYDSTTRRLTMLVPSRPELQKVSLGTVKAVSYRAGDGTMVPAYLTLPPAGTGKKLPAIVMPHGGPASRDEWGFDWWAQFFVSRGFAVLQPNFRGSSGYGEQWFQQNGFKSWKTAIGDVNDAGRWLVSEGIADPNQLAIVGWSYGGYAALQANVVDPDLFKAVIAVAPVTDLGLLRSEQRGFVNMRVAQEFIGDGPHIEQGSPARHAAAFKAPVLIFHGDKDINVSLKESRQMDSLLKKAGKKSELIVYRKLDHQLDDSEARADMLSRSEAFLRAALKL